MRWGKTPPLLLGLISHSNPTEVLGDPYLIGRHQASILFCAPNVDFFFFLLTSESSLPENSSHPPVEFLVNLYSDPSLMISSHDTLRKLKLLLSAN